MPQIFTSSSGVLTFKKSPNYEMAADLGPDNSTSRWSRRPTSTVQATDRHEPMPVTVEVTNVDEPGVVTLSALRPQSEVPLTHRNRDRPDDSISGTTWSMGKCQQRVAALTFRHRRHVEHYTPVD